MSEPEVSIRLKANNNEFEVRGKEAAVNGLIEKRLLGVLRAFESAITTIKPTVSKEKKKEEVEEEEKKKAEKRGGPRSAVIGPAIDRLIEDGWFDEHRRVPDAVRELRSRGVPGPTDQNVLAACTRRVTNRKLKTILDGEQRVFWREKT